MCGTLFLRTVKALFWLLCLQTFYGSRQGREPQARAKVLVEQVAAEQFHVTKLGGGQLVRRNLLITVIQGRAHLGRYVHVESVRHFFSLLGLQFVGWGQV